MDHSARKLSQILLSLVALCVLGVSSCTSESWVTMKPESEPGDPLSVIGVVVDESTGKPIDGAFIELVQADASGEYSKDSTAWNPRLKAQMLSAKSGEFRMDTIRPGGYQDDEGRDVPAHIHFNIRALGYRDYFGEILLGDDPLIPRRGQEGVSDRGELTAVVAEEAGLSVARVTIPLQPVR